METAIRSLVFAGSTEHRPEHGVPVSGHAYHPSSRV
jgi:hypothetical protein